VQRLFLKNRPGVFMDILTKIKRLIVSGNVGFTKKAEYELEIDHLSPELVFEAILNAPGIKKKIRSVNPISRKSEYLYIIIGLTYDDMPIYTKGKIVKSNGEEFFYILISSKRSVTR
jgi:hypothetical protein